MLRKILREAIPPIAAGLLVLASMGPATAAPKTLMLFGDSLMAGFGLPAEEGFAENLAAGLKAQGLDVTIVNASVSGDTSGAALARLDWSLADKPDAVLVGLGGNDMLRGLPSAELEANLRAILTRLQAERIPSLLLGMRASPGLGNDYVTAFEAVYPALSEEFGVPLYPFFLEGVALDASLNQPDGIHPNAAGVKVIVRALVPTVKAFLGRAEPQMAG